MLSDVRAIVNMPMSNEPVKLRIGPIEHIQYMNFIFLKAVGYDAFKSN